MIKNDLSIRQNNIQMEYLYYIFNYITNACSVNFSKPQNKMYILYMCICLVTLSYSL